MGSEPRILVIGGGIAGSLLSYFLLKAGATILLVDEGGPKTASRVAGGLFNPITGRKMVKTWMADPLFPFLTTFYPSLEKELKGKFFQPMPMLRVFASQKQANDWEASLADNRAYASELNHPFPEFIDAPFGGMQIANTGWVNTSSLLHSFHAFFEQQGVLKRQRIDYGQIEIQHKTLYRGEAFDQVVFCEGYGATLNPYFNWLPFSATKGELFLIHLENGLENTIYNKSVFMIPVDEYQALVGSTYNRDDLSLKFTDSGREDLKLRLENLYKGNYTILEERVGIRPNVRDRRPIMGSHPKIEQMKIFNGLGSKGVSMGPFLAKLMAHHMLNDGDLPPEAHISRFFSFFEG